MDFQAVLDHLSGLPNTRIVPLTVEILNVMATLSGLELHDRIIVATALVLNAPLITRDGPIRESGLVECIW